MTETIKRLSSAKLVLDSQLDRLEKLETDLDRILKRIMNEYSSAPYYVMTGLQKSAERLRNEIDVLRLKMDEQKATIRRYEEKL